MMEPEQGACTGLHPYGWCPPGVGCKRTYPAFGLRYEGDRVWFDIVDHSGVHTVPLSRADAVLVGGALFEFGRNA